MQLAFHIILAFLLATFTSSGAVNWANHHVIVQDSVHIESPDYPEPYHGEVSISWDCIRSSGVWIVKFEGLDLYSRSRSCGSNVVVIKEQGFPSVKICGADVPQPYKSKSSRITITFRKQKGNKGLGFRAHVQHAATKGEVQALMSDSAHSSDSPLNVIQEQEIILFSLIGCVVLTLFLLVVMCCYITKQWRKEKKNGYIPCQQAHQPLVGDLRQPRKFSRPMKPDKPEDNTDAKIAPLQNGQHCGMNPPQHPAPRPPTPGSPPVWVPASSLNDYISLANTHSGVPAEHGQQRNNAYAGSTILPTHFKKDQLEDAKFIGVM